MLFGRRPTLAFFVAALLLSQSVFAEAPEATALQEHYKPTAEWVVKITLPASNKRRTDGGVLAEVIEAPASQSGLKGHHVWLNYGVDKESKAWFRNQRQDVRFGALAKMNKAAGTILPEAIDGWKNVSPLESLAAARPGTDMLVRLEQPVVKGDSLSIGSMPVQVAAPQMALVQFQKKTAPDQYEVRHYNPVAKDFSGPLEIIHINQAPGPPDPYLQPGNVEGIEKQALNAGGWMIYGNRDGEGRFAAEALEPRSFSLVSAPPKSVESGLANSLAWRDQKQWADLDARKGTAEQSLLNPNPSRLSPASSPPLGKKFLVLHAFGANDQTPKTMGLVTGHFSYGVATVKAHPFTGEPMYEVVYDQIYVQNTKGIVAGKSAWHEYMGNLNRGWMYARPVSDVLIDIPELFEPFTLAGKKADASVYLNRALEEMMAKYRHGKGGGVTIVTLTESCIQDSNQSVLNAIKAFHADLVAHPEIGKFIRENPNDPEVLRLKDLAKVTSDYKSRLSRRGLLSHLGPFKIPDFVKMITGWRTSVPRRGHDEVMGIFLKNGKAAVVLETFQIGGEMSHIRPLEPASFLRNQRMLSGDQSWCSWFWSWLQ